MTTRTLAQIQNDIARIEARPLSPREIDALCEPLLAELARVRGEQALSARIAGDLARVMRA